MISFTGIFLQVFSPQTDMVTFQSTCFSEHLFSKSTFSGYLLLLFTIFKSYEAMNILNLCISLALCYTLIWITPYKIRFLLVIFKLVDNYCEWCMLYFDCLYCHKPGGIYHFLQCPGGGGGIAELGLLGPRLKLWPYSENNERLQSHLLFLQKATS